MSLLQNQDMKTYEYTRKKFNSDYSHKQLGLYLTRGTSQKKNGIQKPIKQYRQKTPINSETIIFRPYALDSEESSKRGTPSLNCISNFPQNPQVSGNNMIPFYCNLLAFQQSVQQSEEVYALKLRRQRALLFMKYIMQFYENGNGWPSVHPNAINNPTLYNSY